LSFAGSLLYAAFMPELYDQIQEGKQLLAALPRGLAVHHCGCVHQAPQTLSIN
jgi:hypothetical protein